MSAHTPGPWEANLDSDHGDYVVWCEDGAFIANVDDGTLREERRVIAFDVAAANARLIAAAPDLLAELKTMAERFRVCCEVSGSDPEYALAAVEKALAIIAKAEGR